MIKLTEITLSAVQPYATQFTWQPMGSTDQWKCTVTADSSNIEFVMVQGLDNEWFFAFTMPTRNTNPLFGGRTTSHTKSGAVGQLNYLRLIRTAGEAILDFCANHAPGSVNISGADSDSDKEHQKTRLYAAFVRDNWARIASAGYVSMQRRDQLWLVRRSNADATGVTAS
jgi:hypothetical protein